jgi:CDP-glucose 4,6-dehydratase
VRTVITLAREAYGQGETAYATAEVGLHEACLLQLDISKARDVLGYVPRWSLQESVCRTMVWYRSHAQGASAKDLCHADIAAYEASQ